MCLYVDEKKTREHSKVKNKTYIFYKEFHIKSYNFHLYSDSLNKLRSLHTPYMRAEIITKKVHAVGYLDIHKNFRGEKSIHGGAIHAYTQKLLETDYSIKVHSDDIIAWGLNSEVCFSKYEFTKESINRLRKIGIILK